MATTGTLSGTFSALSSLTSALLLLASWPSTGAELDSSFSTPEVISPVEDNSATGFGAGLFSELLESGFSGAEVIGLVVELGSSSAAAALADSAGGAVDEAVGGG